MDLLSDRSGCAEGSGQLVEGTLADRAGRVAEDEEDDGGQSHDREDGPEPVRSVRGQVVVGIWLRFRITMSALGTTRSHIASFRSIKENTHRVKLESIVALGEEVGDSVHCNRW